MIRTDDVWDATTAVLRTRGRVLLSIAALGFFVPSALQAGLKAYGGTSPVAAALLAVLALLALGLVLWAQLAVIAVASDSATTGAQAGAIARRRLPRALLVAVVLFAVFLVALAPIALVLLATGYDFGAAAGQGGSSGDLPVSPAAALFCIFYSLLLLVAGLWFGARLFLVNAVVLHEGRGIGALPRSLGLTRGLTIKLIGVALVFLLVYLVAAMAARAVVFIPFRLILGPEQIATATFLGGLAAAAVGALFNTVIAAFAGRLYVAIQGRADPR